MAGVVDPCWRKPGFVSCDIFLRFSGVLRRRSWRRTGGCCRPRSTPACLAVPCCADGCVRVRVLGCVVWPVFAHRNGSWIPLAQRQLEEDAHGGREDARAQRESGEMGCNRGSIVQGLPTQGNTPELFGSLLSSFFPCPFLSRRTQGRSPAPAWSR